MKSLKNIEEYIPGFEGRYVVSTLGYVRRVGSQKRNFGTINNRGYCGVHIKDNAGKSRWLLVSRVVADVFIPNPGNRTQVDHIDTNRQNNRVDNLRWAWPRENMRNYKTVCNKKQLSLFRRKNDRKSCKVTAPDGTVRYFHSLKETALALEASPTSVSRAYHGDQELIFGSYRCEPWDEGSTPELFQESTIL